MSQLSPGTSAWSPLRRPMFRALWAAQTVSNFGTWMQNVGAAWLMATLAPSPIMVALVQSATSLPAFLVALPAGALADVLDRRRVLLFAQTWMAFAAFALGVLTFAGKTTPLGLLLLTFALGLGSAMNGPAWQATVHELVEPDELLPAVALNSVGFNVARAIGPALGGLVVALIGAAMNFTLNAISFAGVIAVLFLWKRAANEFLPPSRHLLEAMKTGVQYLRQSAPVRAVLVRAGAFVFCASALWALMPLVAKEELHTQATGYGLLLGLVGGGAVVGGLFLSYVRRFLSANVVVSAGAVLFAGGTFALGYVRSFAFLAVAMLGAGVAWTSVMSSLNVGVQMASPTWVRARMMAVYLFVFQAAQASGSAVWGTIASHFGLATSFLIATIGLLATLALSAAYPVKID